MKTTDDGKHRMVYLDFIKGFLMLLVMWSHSTAYIHAFGDYLTYAYMAVYFFIAGYVMNTEVSFHDFLISRAKRCLYPYLIYGIFFSILYCVIKHCSLYEIAKVIFGFLYCRKWLTQYTGILWFFGAMLLTSLAVHCFFNVKKRQTRAIICVLCVILSILLPLLLPPNLLLPWSLEMIPLYTLLMIAGKYFRKYESSISVRYKSIVGFITLPFYILAVRYLPEMNLGSRVYSQYGIVAVILATFICFSGSYLWVWGGYYVCRNKENNILIRSISYIGRNSITYMCIHQFILSFSCQILLNFSLSYFQIGIIGLLISLIAATALTYLYNFLRKKGMEIVRYL